ncbi:hypothetical protein K5X82_05115 [Halosquirtibacter xylanolyticus]|uniref:alpha-2-macroglobulin family protein n=1 Tax=Halosquirtibacter xylanolyticus TaxID=3374599 RepID=UPI00374A76D3|nr:hypothetical protein K5X82_05115 [Prolixibacteraceae bacterium]
MRQFIFFLIILFYYSPADAQNSLTPRWKQVEGYEQSGQLKDANKLVEKILVTARQDQQTDQIVKAFIYKSKFSLLTSEDNFQDIFKELKKEISISTFPTKQLLHYVYGNMLQQYFRRNTYQIEYNKCTEEALTIDNIDLWSKAFFLKKIKYHFQRTLTPRVSLEKETMKDYSELLNIEGSIENVSGSLYDFFAMNIIDFYLTHYPPRTAVLKEKYIPLLYGTDKKFLNVSFEKIAIQYPVFNAFIVYQSLYTPNSTSHQQAEYSIGRLKLANQIFQDEGIYLEGLESLINQYSSDAQDLIKYNLAKKLSDYGYIDTKKIMRKQAVGLCNDIIESDTPLKSKAIILKQEITTSTVSVYIDGFCYPNKATLSYIRYNNLDSIYLLFYPLSIQSNKELSDSIVFERYVRSVPLFVKEYSLPNSNNYYETSTEIIIPPLNSGKYLIVVSKVREPIFEDQILCYKNINATRLSSTLLNKSDSIYIMVSDCMDGRSLENVGIDIESSFGNQTKHEGGKTNKNGIWKSQLLASNHATDNTVYITYQDDTITHTINEYTTNNFLRKQTDQPNNIVLNLFTDRSIYRPGQKILFKGTVHRLGSTKDRRMHVIPNESVTISLEHNGEDIKKLHLKTNAYGSIHDSISIPSNIRTGYLRLKIENELEADSTHNKPYAISETVPLSLEEYKRPTFQLTFDPINRAIVENDSVKITGKVNSYVGTAISNATVKYEVERDRQFDWSAYEYDKETKLITSGKTTTNAQGKFSFNFITEVSDSFIDYHVCETFDINIEVTDKNGETQSKHIMLNVSSVDLQATIHLEESFHKNQSFETTIETKNCNESFIPSQLNIQIHQYTRPTKAFLERNWLFPDTSIIPKKTFTRLFPQYAYNKNETEEYWPIGKCVCNQNIKSNGNYTFKLNDIKKWKPGNYEMTVTAINQLQDTIVTSKKFKVIEDVKKKANIPTFFDYSVKIKNDTTVTIKLRTSQKKLMVYMQAFMNGKDIDSRNILINKRVKNIDIPFHTNRKTEIDFHFHVIQYGKDLSKRTSVTYEPKMFKPIIETVSFRNKIEPGVKEKWSFRIKNTDSVSDTFEVLASMYDCSLDKFIRHQWSPIKEKTSYYYNPNIQLLYPYFYHFSIHRNMYFYHTSNRWTFNWFGMNTGWTQQSHIEFLEAQKNKNKIRNDKAFGFILDEYNNPLPNTLIQIKGDTAIYKTFDNGFYMLPFVKGMQIHISRSGFQSRDHVVKHKGGCNLILLKVKNEVPKDHTNYFEQYSRAVFLDVYMRLYYHEVLKQNKVAFFDDKIQYIEDEIPLSMGSNIPSPPPPSPPEYISSITRSNEMIDQRNSSNPINIPIRENLKETAFFYPELHTDKDGVVSFEFNSPEAMTRWKLMLFAHNKNFDFGQKTLTTVTQKEVFITPNAPRFLREGDRVVFGAKIDNLTDVKQIGTAMLVLYDAANDKEIFHKEVGLDATKPFEIKAKNSQAISWEFTVPSDIYSLKYKMIAKTLKHSDGEANVLPVLSKKVLVTESMPIWVNPHSTEQITFENLKGKQKSASDHRMILEYTPNTLWNVVESLPYLMEYPHGCAEQTFSKYYANAIAHHILEKNPKIKALLKKWKNNPAMTIEAMNPSLRTSLLEATPWIDQLDNDTKKKAKLARLLDSTTLLEAQRKALERVRTMQLSSGAFPWFAGGRPNEYITQHILVTLSHIKKLDADKANRTTLDAIAKNAIGYLDRQFLGRFNRIKDNTLRYTDLKPIDIHYLYIRSHFIKEVPISSELKKIVNKQIQVIKENWVLGSMYAQAMTAICLQNMGEHKAAKQILKSFDQYAIYAVEKGMYWKRDSYGWFWNNSQLETHTMIMDAYQQVEGDSPKSARMKQALLYMKKNQHWATTKATTEAIYTLLMTGTSMDAIKMDYTIKIGDRAIDQIQGVMKSEVKTTGNIQVTWTPKEVTDKDATITIENRGTTIGTGAAYWQYWQELNDIQSNPDAPVFIQKKLYKQEADGNTLKWVPVDQHHIIHLGDKVKVQLNVESKENLEFVHLKDLRASGFEPIDVISKHHYRYSASYYQSTKDVATHFYFDHLYKGKYTFEYEVRANNKGDYTGGNATIQSMYAPEYGNTSRSETISIQ